MVFKGGQSGFIPFFAYLLIGLFVVGIGFYVVGKVFNESEPMLRAKMNTSASNAVLNSTNSLTDGLSYVFLMIFAGALIFCVVSAFVANEHPVLFVVSLLAMVALGVVGMMLSNTFEDFNAEPQFAAESAQYSDINSALTKLPIFVVIGIVISMAIAYSRWNQS